jgi:hypothetical protein
MQTNGKPDRAFVYPGQPLVVACMVMQTFPTFESAMKRTEHGWPAALGSTAIHGAGCAVYNALDLLQRVNAGMAPLDAVQESRAMWQRYVGHQASLKDRVQPGLDAQLTVEEEFVIMASSGGWS